MLPYFLGLDVHSTRFSSWSSFPELSQYYVTYWQRPFDYWQWVSQFCFWMDLSVLNMQVKYWLISGQQVNCVNYELDISSLTFIKQLYAAVLFCMTFFQTLWISSQNLSLKRIIHWHLCRWCDAWMVQPLDCSLYLYICCPVWAHHLNHIAQSYFLLIPRFL